MFELILDGVFVGLILTLFVGPAFFYLIKVSLEKGFISAMIFALGIIVSDLILISLIYLGFSSLLESILFQQIFSISSGLILLVLGFNTFRRKVRDNKELSLQKGNKTIWYFLKGMLINGVNPFTLMIWVGVIGAVGVRQTYTAIEFRYFFTGILLTIFLADILKAYFANKIRILINENLLRKINRILAILFIILGARMILFFFSILYNWEGLILLDFLL